MISAAPNIRVYGLKIDDYALFLPNSFFLTLLNYPNNTLFIYICQVYTASAAHRP